MAQADTHPLPAGTHRHALNWSAAIWASVIAGLVFAVLETVLAPVARGASPWMLGSYISEACSNCTGELFFDEPPLT